MANKFRNEMEIKLGEEVILLRPSFENMQDMESNMGGISYIAYMMTRHADEKLSMHEKTKLLPPLTFLAQLIYFNQVARKEDDPSLRKFSLEEIWELVQLEGLKVIRPLMTYITLMTSGNKNATPVSDEEKKS